MHEHKAKRVNMRPIAQRRFARQHDQDHHQITNSLDPMLECDEGIIRPQNAKARVKEEKYDCPIVAKDGTQLSRLLKTTKSAKTSRISKPLHQEGCPQHKNGPRPNFSRSHPKPY